MRSPAAKAASGSTRLGERRFAGNRVGVWSGWLENVHEVSYRFRVQLREVEVLAEGCWHVPDAFLQPVAAPVPVEAAAGAVLQDADGIVTLDLEGYRAGSLNLVDSDSGNPALTGGQ